MMVNVRVCIPFKLNISRALTYKVMCCFRSIWYNSFVFFCICVLFTRFAHEPKCYLNSWCHFAKTGY